MQIVLTVSCMTYGVIMIGQSNHFGHGGCTGPTIDHSATLAIMSVYMMPMKKLDYVICLLCVYVYVSTYLCMYESARKPSCTKLWQLLPKWQQQTLADWLLCTATKLRYKLLILVNWPNLPVFYCQSLSCTILSKTSNIATIYVE